MNRFRKFELDLWKSRNIELAFYESIERRILLVKISGRMMEGSEARDEGRYVKQQLGLALWTFEPMGIILDMVDLHYSYGDSIIEAFRPLSETNMFGGDGFHIAYILSEKNKRGLSVLWGFDIDEPGKNIFYDFNQGYDYVIREYDK